MSNGNLAEFKDFLGWDLREKKFLQILEALQYF